MKVRFTFSSLEKELLQEAPIFFEKTYGFFFYDWNYPFFPSKGDFIDWQHTIPAEIYDNLPMKEQVYIDCLTQCTVIEELLWEIEKSNITVNIALKSYE